MRIGVTKRHSVAGILMAAMLWTVPVKAAVVNYMTVMGSSQGRIRGDVTTDNIPIKSVTHDEIMATGTTAGKRQHGTITIVREQDAASPKLMQAMNAHETLSELTIVFGGSGAGKGKVAQVVEIKDAVPVSVRIQGQYEVMTFSYESVVVSYVGGTKSATDDWQAQK